MAGRNKEYVVKYQMPNSDTVERIELIAINVLHAEKLAKEKLGKDIFVQSVSSKRVENYSFENKNI